VNVGITRTHFQEFVQCKVLQSIPDLLNPDVWTEDKVLESAFEQAHLVDSYADAQNILREILCRLGIFVSFPPLVCGAQGWTLLPGFT